MHQSLHNRSYLVNLVAYKVTDPQRRQLRSSTTRAAVIRRTRTDLESVHSLSAVLTSGTVFMSQLETLTIIQHSDEHSSRICSIVFFPRNCLHSLYCTVGFVCIVGQGTITLCCIVFWLLPANRAYRRQYNGIGD